MAIKQIRYGCYGQEPEEHRNYWRDIDNIGRFIASELEGYRSIFDRSTGAHVPYKHTTILVSQYKEKFGEVRVYCMLGYEELIKDKYNNHTKQTDPTTLEEFADKCLMSDYRHYRSVYLIAKEMWPHYWSAISDGADYPIFIQETKEELQKFVNHNREYYTNNYPAELVKVVCGFTYD